ncbi:MAG: DNA translocase FtsK 4TM domain-containing protein [Armatimonadetes bacterium]|nr:DNA translocase FtsK 4TM domain-containing protein [Armatimonadota bacterium]
MKKPRHFNKNIKRRYIDAVNPKSSIQYLEILGIIFIILAIFLFFSSIFPKSAGDLGFKLKENLFQLLGKGSYFLPLLIFLLGAQFIFPQRLISALSLFFNLIILLFSICLFFQLSEAHGGRIGTSILTYLKPKIGKSGSYILDLGLAVIILLIIGKFSLKNIFYNLSLIFNFLKNLFPKKNADSKEIPLFPVAPSDEIPLDLPKMENDEFAQEIFISPQEITTLRSLQAEENINLPQAEERSANLEQLELFKDLKENKNKSPITSNYKIIKYKLPALSLLNGLEKNKKGKITQDYSQILTETLESFGVKVQVVHIERGPTVTRYELKPERGVKVSKITNLANDIALVLAAQSIRIEAPIPGKSALGIEIPNQRIDPVHIKEILESNEYKKNSKFTLALGKDITGNPVIADLIKMTHLLIAGATGSGKTVCLNTIIASLMFNAAPNEIQFLMIDPKRVELTIYEGIAYLIDNDFTQGPRVITDPKLATLALKALTEEMDKRYTKFSEVRARNILEYNQHCFKNNLEIIPYIILFIDELADLMMLSASAVETYICRLAQLGRASGIHLVIATQRPSVDVITGLIKANISSRIAFAVTSQIDSRTIMDRMGAEKLLGKGDMLYSPIDAPEPKRIQGAYIDANEIDKLVEYWSNQEEPKNKVKLFQEFSQTKDSLIKEDDDALYQEALQIILSSAQASVSILQRKLKIGYARAGRLIDLMEKRGIVGPAEGSKPRKILISLSQEKIKGE